MEVTFNDSLLDDDYDVVEENENVETSDSNENENVEESIVDDNDDEDESSNNEESNPDYSDDAVYSFLQSRGISDPSKIQFENEDGEIEERDFKDLSIDEQKEVLSQLTDPGISDYEYSVINYMRQNNVNLDQIIDYYSNQRLQEYLQQNPEAVHQKSYSIDEYTDDELYVADLKTKYPDFTDDELLSKLDSAKNNNELFEKEVNALRTQYKVLEDQERINAEAREKQEYEDLRDNLSTAVSNFKGIYLDYTDPKSDSLVIEDADHREMLSYMLDQDKTGKSRLAKDLEDPDALAEIAWFRINGAKVLSETTQFYKKQIRDRDREIAKLKGQMEKKNKSASVVVPSNPNLKQNSDEVKIDHDYWDAYV